MNNLMMNEQRIIMSFIFSFCKTLPWIWYLPKQLNSLLIKGYKYKRNILLFLYEKKKLNFGM